MHPLVLQPNLPDTFYRGSGRLAEFRRRPLPDLPEDWIASCTTRFGGGRSGISPLPDGRLLTDAVDADPVGWLGPDRGNRPALLVKLLDAGQRLPVHFHPDRGFAGRHLASRFGKTEAWIILQAVPGAAVHLGFRREVASTELARWVAEQDVDAMLGATNRVPVAAGDVLYCPAGLPHAIGEGILLLELQEPTDFSILLEQAGFPVDPAAAMLGLPAEVALGCVSRTRLAPDALHGLRGDPAGPSLLPPGAETFFHAERVGAGDVASGFAVLVVTGGEGMLTGGWGSTPLRSGDTAVLPHGAGPARLGGELEAICCRPGR